MMITYSQLIKVIDGLLLAKKHVDSQGDDKNQNTLFSAQLVIAQLLQQDENANS